MGSVGVDLTPDRVWVVFKRPFVLIIGLLLNHLAVPLLALGIARACELTPAVTTGFILCAAAPGGPLGAMFTQRAKGNIAFAASLIVVMTAHNTVTTPALLSRLVDIEVGDGGSSHVWPVVRTIIAYLLTPLVVGMLLRRYKPAAADVALVWLKRGTNALFGVLFVGIIGTRWRLIGEIGGAPFFAMLVCAACCALAGYIAAGRHRDLRIALALNTTIRNISLSLLLASLWFSDDATMLTVMIYGLVMILIALPTMLILRRGGAEPLTP